MAKSEETVKIEIKNYIDKEGSSYSEWYVGITDNPEERLFDEHGVDRGQPWWIYEECFNATSARRVEDYFINTLETDGGGGGGD